MNRFQSGDLVIVSKGGRSAASRDHVGETFEVFTSEIKTDPIYRGQEVISSGPNCSGYYADELELSPLNGSPLLEALK